MKKMKKSGIIIVLFSVLTISCKVLVSPVTIDSRSDQDKHLYHELQLEYVTTKTASQKNQQILVADVINEMKLAYGNVTIVNIRYQNIKEKGTTTYYMIFDVVKVLSNSNFK